MLANDQTNKSTTFQNLSFLDNQTQNRQIKNLILATRCKSTGKPSRVLIHTPNGRIELELWRKGAGKSLKTIYDARDCIQNVISSTGDSVVFFDDYNWFLRQFDIVHLQSNTDHNDLAFDELYAENEHNDSVVLNAIADGVVDNAVGMWTSILAKSQYAYNQIERTGLLLNYDKINTNWNYKTYTGRSKSIGFNIQGHTEPDVINRPTVGYEGINIHLDWSSADMRVLGLLSNDDVLNSTFTDSDPYSLVAEVIGSNRSQAKLTILKSVYALNFSDGILSSIFTKAYEWLYDISVVANSRGYSTNMFGRKFLIGGERTDKSAVNAVLQGTIACLAQLVVARIHKLYPEYLITDLHDGIVLSVPCDEKIVSNVLNTSVGIMRDPLSNGSMQMPLTASIGKKWKVWEKINVQ